MNEEELKDATIEEIESQVANNIQSIKRKAKVAVGVTAVSIGLKVAATVVVTAAAICYLKDRQSDDPTCCCNDISQCW